MDEPRLYFFYVPSNLSFGLLAFSLDIFAVVSVSSVGLLVT